MSLNQASPQLQVLHQMVRKMTRKWLQKKTLNVSVLTPIVNKNVLTLIVRCQSVETAVMLSANSLTGDISGKAWQEFSYHIGYRHVSHGAGIG